MRPYFSALLACFITVTTPFLCFKAFSDFNFYDSHTVDATDTSFVWTNTTSRKFYIISVEVVNTAAVANTFRVWKIRDGVSNVIVSVDCTNEWCASTVKGIYPFIKNDILFISNSEASNDKVITINREFYQ